MLKEEFLEKIHRVQESTIKEVYFYMCISLGKQFGSPDTSIWTDNDVTRAYAKLFRPEEDKDIFFGNNFQQANKELRLTSLHLFKEYCLQHQLYRKW